MNISAGTVSTLLGVIACQRAAISLQLPATTGPSHLKRKQSEDEGDVSLCIAKKRRVLAPLPRRLQSMSTAAGVRAAVEARAVVRMTSVAVPAATLVGATALCPPPPPPCLSVLTSAYAAVQSTVRPFEGRQIAMCRRRHDIKDIEMKDVSATPPMSATVQATTGPNFQQAPKSVLARRKFAVPRKRLAKKEDEAEDMEVD